MQEHRVRACLITNPRSGRGGIDLSDVLPILQAHGWKVVVRQKLRGGHATELARGAVQEGYSVVVNCGGDGTLREIVEGVIGSEAAVGVLPGGTVNLWARELGVSPQLRVAALQLISSERRRVDVGHLTVNGRHERHFLLMAGLGADGAVMAHVSKPLKNRIGRFAVGLAALRAMPSFAALPVQVDLDDLHWHGRVSQIIVSNTRRYGGFTRITPDAFIDDGVLDVCLITAAGPVSAARQLASLVLRQRPHRRTAETYRAAQLVIRSPIRLPLQLDGGAVRLKKVQPTADGIVYRFSVVAAGLTVLTPRSYDGALFTRLFARQTPPSAAGAVDTVVAPLVGTLAAPANGPRPKAGKEKEVRRTLRVQSIDEHGFSAVRTDNGQLVTVFVEPGTEIVDALGMPVSSWQSMSGLPQDANVDLMATKLPERGTRTCSKSRGGSERAWWSILEALRVGHGRRDRQAWTKQQSWT